MSEGGTVPVRVRPDPLDLRERSIDPRTSRLSPDPESYHCDRCRCLSPRFPLGLLSQGRSTVNSVVRQ